MLKSSSSGSIGTVLVGGPVGGIEGGPPLIGGPELGGPLGPELGGPREDPGGPLLTEPGGPREEPLGGPLDGGPDFELGGPDEGPLG